MEADIICVGAGLAGLSAGLRAAELGLNVIVLEQGSAPAYSCNSRISAGGFSMCYIDPSDDPGKLAELIFSSTGGLGGRERATVYANSAMVVLNWLKKRGTRFMRIGPNPQTQWVMTPIRRAQPGLDWEGRGPDVLLRKMAEDLKGLGGHMLYDTTARELIIDGDECAGVIADRDGQEIRLFAEAVVLADGGFQADLDLVKRFISPAPEKLMRRHAGSGRGSGLRMAEAVGAKLTGMDRFYGHLLSQDAFTNDKLWPVPFLDFVAGAAIVVDGSGQRFVDEGRGGVYIANIIAQRENPLDAYIILDEPIWSGPGTDPLRPPAPNPNMTAMGAKIYKASTLQELAAAVPLPYHTLAETVSTYNAALSGDTLDQMTPPRVSHILKPYPISKGPFYAIPLCAGLSYTMGGPEIDAHGRVLDHEDRPIPGLFAAGATSGGLEGGPFAGYVGGLIKALISGFLAADYVAQSRQSVGAVL